MRIHLTQKMMIWSLISRSASAVAELNVIAKICKYRGPYERHHFIPMAMEMHCKPKCNMDHFIRECARFFYNKQWRNPLSLSFCIQFFRQRVNIALQHVLAFVIKKKIVLMNDVCFKHPITIRSQVAGM
jgi:hypothetical protein